MEAHWEQCGMAAFCRRSRQLRASGPQNRFAPRTLPSVLRGDTSGTMGLAGFAGHAREALRPKAAWPALPANATL
jgi:hypothetical protein